MSILETSNVGFAYRRGPAVLHDVSFAVTEGRNLAIVGESGAGKTTLLRLLLGLASPTTGDVTFDGTALLRERAYLRSFRRNVQAVFQDPYSSLDPRQTVGRILAEPLRSLKIPGAAGPAIAAALKAVDLPADAVSRYPHEFSGGQRQRIAIARAIIPGPRVLLADEPVSALDVSTRVRIVDLLASLSESITVVLVSHDLGVVAALCQDTVVLERGRVVEAGATESVLRSPASPYTRRLLASVPRLSAPGTEAR
ncbi:ABC transporter ATP-binding protein [Glaciihabitans sp. dw_435]|uniref:ABC transporter ATP-binding protein n=1 Tax=Glaciihabitans sp. dw_435 TaxID=2720081 RepID=UPI001BD65C88|nr:ATP-binding cassette domain-containing protein [Glaciihabitans sp. dw_435]